MRRKNDIIVMLLLTKKLLQVLSCFDTFFQSGHLQKHFSFSVLLPNKTEAYAFAPKVSATNSTFAA